MVRVRYLTQAQAKILLDRLPAHQREVVLFALATGLRPGNILNLTWDQVHLDLRMAMIEHGDTKNGEALAFPRTMSLLVFWNGNTASTTSMCSPIAATRFGRRTTGPGVPH